MHLPLWPIFRQSHPNFINVRTAYASKIVHKLTKIFSQNQAQKDPGGHQENKEARKCQPSVF